MNYKKVPEWQGFKIEDHFGWPTHIYIAATGGGDGWEVDNPHDLHSELVNDYKWANDDDTPDFDQMADWINTLEVYRWNEEDQEYSDRVARFDTREWVWVEEQC